MTTKDEQDRVAMARVSGVIAALNNAVRDAKARRIRIEVGTVTTGYNSSSKVASEWRELWTEDGLAVRFTREEIFAAPKPEPPVTDGAPNIAEIPS